MNRFISGIAAVSLAIACGAAAASAETAGNRAHRGDGQRATSAPRITTPPPVVHAPVRPPVVHEGPEHRRVERWASWRESDHHRRPRWFRWWW